MVTTTVQFKRYIWLFSSTLLVLLIFASSINYLIDPYGLFDTPRIDGINKLKPGATSRDRIVKPYMVDSFQPRTLIVGNSRPKMGIDPSNSCWPTNYRPIYNMGLPGAGVYMLSRHIQHAAASNTLQNIYWGLDFVDFLNKENNFQLGDWPPAAETFEERLRINADGSANSKYAIKRIKDYFGILLSIDTLNDSVHTLLSQSNHNAETVRRDGFNPAREHLDIMALEGQGLIFKQKNIALINMFSKYDNTLLLTKEQNSLQYESIRQILQMAKIKGINIVLFINPYHSDYLTIIRQAGKWDQFLLWKRQLTKLAEEFNAPLWDFSGFNYLSNIQPPETADKKALLQWFWEPAHYRKQYGNLMLTQMLNAPCDQADLTANGVLLTESNINDHLRDANASMLRYEFEHSRAIKRLHKLKD
jgi:hypothetical protein